MFSVLNGDLASLRQRELAQEAYDYRRHGRPSNRPAHRKLVQAQRHRLGLALINLGMRFAEPALAERNRHN